MLIQYNNLNIFINVMYSCEAKPNFQQPFEYAAQETFIIISVEVFAA